VTQVRSESQSPPRLSVVEETPTTEEAPAPRKRSALANWLLLAATLLFAWLWLHQLEQTRLLADERAALQSELVIVRAEIVAREAHLQDVRSEVDAVASQVARLKALAGSAPAAAAAQRDAPPPSAESFAPQRF